VQQEYHAAINHQTKYPGFRIIPVRLDDVEPPGFLQNYSYVTLGKDGLDRHTAAGILKGLYGPAAPLDLVAGRNTYVSRGWHLDDADVATVVCGALEDAGLQLVGDAEDQTSWVETRVRDILATCGAFAAILPYRPQSPHMTSKYVLREWELAASAGLPCLVVADPRTELPADIAGRPGLVYPDGPDVPSQPGLAEAAAELAEDWVNPDAPYVFYATDFDAENGELRGLVKEVVESVTAMPCVLGEYIKGDPVQREILNAVTQARLLIADVTGGGANVYIEIGAARAANVPIFLLRAGPPGRPVFLLRDRQVWDYNTDAELLARVTQVSYPYRRTVLNRERR
jgi:hypothetical protein